ncbi:MAG: hypothetical protein HYR97_01350 [Candidatus Melainabacteria bacterium]|nr:hypothetical protein [Candidatus Melainabacteria bacterium]
MEDNSISSQARNISNSGTASAAQNGQQASANGYVKGLLENKRAELLGKLDQMREGDNNPSQTDFMKLKLKKIDELIKYANNYEEAKKAANLLG